MEAVGEESCSHMSTGSMKIGGTWTEVKPYLQGAARAFSLGAHALESSKLENQRLSAASCPPDHSNPSGHEHKLSPAPRAPGCHKVPW